MIYHNNILCVTGSELLVALGTPKKYRTIKEQSEVIQRACKGHPALISFSSLPMHVRGLFPEPDKQATKSSFVDKIVNDGKAVTFYTNYQLADGRVLGEIEHGKYVSEYAANANILNAIDTIFKNASEMRKNKGGNMKGFWHKAIAAVNELNILPATNSRHTLPTTHERLYKTYKKYKSEGYEALISKKFCNDNTRKVSSDLERLLMSLYTMPNKPFAADVYTMYAMFMAGKIDLLDKVTGEMFSPAMFTGKKGEPLTISESTVWNYLNKCDNRPVVDAKRNGTFQFNGMHRPHHNRKAPNYAFSKISMDDRDLPRKCSNGSRVKAYYAYDVASGCVIGRAYSMNKDEQLFLDCMRDMFRLIEKNAFGMPAEVEVENHLVNKFFDDLGFMFPFVRICNPGNSQEKHAEHLNRAKKYGAEKKAQTGIGRWWARSEAYRTDVTKVNDEYTERVYTYESLVADDIAAVNTFNNQLHPKKKKYPNKTRWQVLVENMNPNISMPSKAIVYKAIGEKTETSIMRNQYCTVQYHKYQLPTFDAVSKLAVNDYSVQAYYLPNDDGIIPEVYLYQGGQFITRAERVSEYNTAKAEWTNIDAQSYTNQAKYVSHFDSVVKQRKKGLANVSELRDETDYSMITTEIIHPQTEVTDGDISDTDWESKAINNL